MVRIFTNRLRPSQQLTNDDIVVFHHKAMNKVYVCEINPSGFFAGPDGYGQIYDDLGVAGKKVDFVVAVSDCNRTLAKGGGSPPVGLENLHKVANALFDICEGKKTFQSFLDAKKPVDPKQAERILAIKTAIDDFDENYHETITELLEVVTDLDLS